MATSVQTTYDDFPAIAYAGQLAHDGGQGHDVASANNSNATAITAGLVVLRSGDRLVRPILSTDEPTADPDAIIASGVASATTRQTITGASLNGVIGQLEISPPLNVTLTFNSHSDWNDTTIIVKGLGAYGEPISETFLVKEGGNEVLTGVEHFSFVTAVIVPPGTSTNGTLLVGTGVSVGPIGRLAAGIAVYDMAREPGTYAQYERLSVLKQGRVAVSAEAAVTEGMPVYVRFVATGGEVRGAMRAAPDSTDCALLPGARWATTTTGAGIAFVNLNLPR
jgi:hypothetical protein